MDLARRSTRYDCLSTANQKQVSICVTVGAARRDLRYRASPSGGHLAANQPNPWRPRCDDTKSTEPSRIMKCAPQPPVCQTDGTIVGRPRSTVTFHLGRRCGPKYSSIRSPQPQGQIRCAHFARDGVPTRYSTCRAICSGCSSTNFARKRTLDSCRHSWTK
jgi:hypothetical protein